MKILTITEKDEFINVKKKLAVLFLLPNSSKKFSEQKRSFRSLFLLLGNTLPPLLHEIWTKFFRLTPCKSFIKRCNVRKKYANILQHIQFINDVSQMSSIYDEVSILAYKILIKNICILNPPYGNETIIILWLNM